MILWERSGLLQIFISHFGHEKEFLWGPRGFTSWEEHAEQVIKNYNSVVDNDDTVYILGDCMLNNDNFGIECLKQLKGHKYLAIGNHDSDARIKKYIENGIFENIQVAYRIKYKKYILWLTHYPMMMGNFEEKKPVFNLSGHTHSSDEYQNIKCDCYNVALDAHNSYPVLVDEVIEKIRAYRKSMEERPQ